LFELEVPELVDGVVEIRAVAREPGHRTKLAVASNDQNVDPVGACVGARGMRVRQVVNELRGEKVDIVPFSSDSPEFVMRALAPAKVREVRLHDDTGIAEVIVPDFQLSLAIGKEGQNARLAARLTGWRVDIKSETQLAEEESGGGVEYAEGEWVENASGELVWQPAEGGDAISAAEAGYAAPFPAQGGGAAAEGAADAPAADAGGTPDAPAGTPDAPVVTPDAPAAEDASAPAGADAEPEAPHGDADATPPVASVAAADGAVAEEESSGES
jgi:N utilization substance protein A